MISPKQLDFSSSGDGDDSDDTLSRRKSHPYSKRTASDVIEAEEETKKKMKINKKKNTKLSSPLIIRISNEEDELSILKGFVDYGAGVQTKTDWDAFYLFYLFLGGSIVAKFSKEQGENGVGMDKEMLKEDKEHLTLVQQQKTGLLDKHIRAKVARLC